MNDKKIIKQLKCEEFDCEFEKTTCDNTRHIFIFANVDMFNAFIIG